MELEFFIDNFFFQAEDGIRDKLVTGVQTCALPISAGRPRRPTHRPRQGPRAAGGGREAGRGRAGRPRARGAAGRGPRPPAPGREGTPPAQGAAGRRGRPARGRAAVPGRRGRRPGRGPRARPPARRGPGGARSAPLAAGRGARVTRRGPRALAAAAPSPLADLTRSARIVVCCGSGGVGKTSTAAAVALWAAANGRRTCVLTIDPARRLAQALGLDLLSNSPKPVTGKGLPAAGPGSLDAMMLDMRRTFDEVT